MAQFARPDSDVQTTSWNCSTGTEFFELINEVTASDGDYVYTDPMGTSTLIVGLSDVTDPESGSGHTIRFRAKSANASKGPESCECLLYEGGTQRATTGAQALTRDTYNTCQYTLSAAEADSIGNYNNLRLEFVPVPGSGANDEVYVSWAELEVPDVGQEYDETGKLVTLLSVLNNSDAYTMAETEKLISAALILDGSDVCTMAEAGKSLTLLSVLDGSDTVVHAESGKELTALADVVGSDGLLYLEIGKLLAGLSGVSGGDALTAGETGMQTLLLVGISRCDLHQMTEGATMVALAEVTGDDEYFPFYSGECAEWGGHGWGWRQA